MDQLTRELNQLHKKHKLQNRELVAIGRIEHIEAIQKKLENVGKQLSAIVDNDSKKVGLVINGVSVYKPEMFLDPFKKNVLILIYSPKYWRDISEQFQAMGYVENEHFIVLGKPSVKNAIKNVRAGERIYQQICGKYGRDVEILVCRGPIGDFYLFGLYLDAYLKKEKISNYVLAGDSKGFTKIADLFAIEKFVLLSEDETDSLIQAYIFVGKERYHVRILTIWQKLSFNSCLVRYRQGFSFMDTIRSFVYNLPMNEKPFTPLFDKMDKELITWCEGMGMKQGKTVVLSPYAYSLQSLPMHFWQQLTNRLSDMGYTVCVNIDIKKEKCELENVIPISFTFRQSAAVLEYAGYLIGIRSGFMDITSGANCRKAVLYPQYIVEKVASQWHRTDMEFSSLVNMGLCQNAFEMEYPLQDENGNSYMQDGKYDVIKTEEVIDIIVENLFKVL